jgi:hypothetical protein
LATYAATSGGHTSSNDEEVLYYVTEGLVERASLALPDEDGTALAACPCPNGVAHAPDGHLYGAYQLLPSVVAAVPFLITRPLTAGLTPPERGFSLRLAVTTQSVVASSLAVVAFAFLLVDLGAAPGAAIALGLILGVATIVWPYSKYFWSEPLAMLFLVLAVRATLLAGRGGGLVTCLAAGLWLGLDGMTRIAMLAGAPACAVYILAQRPPDLKYRSLLAWAAGLLGPLMLIGWYNALRFGSPFDTGQTLAAFGRREDGGAPVLGLLAAFFSPGKGAIWYSPPLVAALAALPAFWNGARPAALLLGGIVVGHLITLGALGYWFGEASWGPRYLVPLTPLLLAPLAAWFPPGRAHRKLALVAVALAGLIGTFLQLGPVATNYATYIAETGGPVGPAADRRWYEPSWSPLLAAPRQALQRLSLYARRLQPGEFGLRDGFYPSEGPSAEPLPRWTDGRGEVGFSARTAGQVELYTRLVQPGSSLNLVVRVDDQLVAPDAWRIEEPQPGHYNLFIKLESMSHGEHRLTLESRTFVPAETSGTDERHLGVRIEGLELDDASGPLDQVDLPLVPPFPGSALRPWSRGAFGWFYDPAIPHLVDIWPWYAARIRLPAWVALFEWIWVIAAVALGSVLLGWLLAQFRGGRTR